MLRLLLASLILATSSWAGSCPALDALVNTATDASSTFQTCYNARGNSTFPILAGLYYFDNTVTLTAQNVTITVVGRGAGDAKCDYTGDATCAEFRARSGVGISPPLFYWPDPAVGVHLDSVIINGNKSARSGTFLGGAYNARVENCTNCSLTRSVSKNAYAGTGWEWYGTATNLTVTDSTFIDNGTHDGTHHADGFTIHDGDNVTITDCLFQDNTDVSFILGGIRNSTVQRNRIIHTAGSWAHSSYAAFLLYAFTNGQYGGTDVSDNYVDCGPNLLCGTGLGVGGAQWNDSKAVTGAAVHDNFVRRAQNLVALPGVTAAPPAVVFRDNIAEDSGSSTICTSGTTRNVKAYMGSGTNAVDFTGDDIPALWYDITGYFPQAGCVPNGTDTGETAYTSNFGSAPSVSVGATSATITWTSGSAKTSEVQYGLTTAYGSTSGINYTTGTSHSVTLAGLTPGTTYHAQAKQKDSVYARTDYSADFTFTTATPIVTRFTGNPRITGNFTIQ